MRLAAQAKGGFYPTPPRVVDLVSKLLYGARGRSRSVDTLRILDPCCGAGDALAQFAGLLRDRGTVPVETCGVELHRDRAEQAAHVLDRALACDLFATSVANNAFGVLLLNPSLRLGQRRQAGGTRLPDPLHQVPDRRRAAAVHSPQAAALRLRPLPLFPLPGHTLLVLPQPGAGGLRPGGAGGPAQGGTQPRPLRRGAGAGWAEGEPEEFSNRPYPVYDPPVVPQGDILFATRTVDPLAAVAEARKTGLWASQEVRDSLWPAQDQRTRPLMPLRRGHMAMLVAAGFLDNLVLEADGRRILVKGRTTKELVLAEETENTEVYRERLRTTVVALDLDDGEITDIAS